MVPDHVVSQSDLIAALPRWAITPTRPARASQAHIREGFPGHGGHQDKGNAYRWPNTFKYRKHDTDLLRLPSALLEIAVTVAAECKLGRVNGHTNSTPIARRFCHRVRAPVHIDASILATCQIAKKINRNRVSSHPSLYVTTPRMISPKISQNA